MPKVTPSQTIGPFFHEALPFPDGERLVAPDAPGAVEIEGRIFDGTGAPVPDAMVEIWQADANGIYRHPDDPRHAEADASFYGWGRVETNEQGTFRFITLKPGRVPRRGNALQAPHISVSIFARGLLDRLMTRIYFADEATANAEDPVLARIDAKADRATLIAQPTERDGRTVYRLDIHLQGDDQTVFFEI